MTSPNVNGEGQLAWSVLNQIMFDLEAFEKTVGKPLRQRGKKRAEVSRRTEG